MHEDFDFHDVLEHALNATTLAEVEEYGFSMYGDEFTTDNGCKMKIIIKELEGKTYLIKYVDDKCVIFDDITAGPRNK